MYIKNRLSIADVNDDFLKWRSVHAYFQIWSERINDEHASRKGFKKNYFQKYVLTIDMKKQHRVIINAQNVKNTIWLKIRGMMQERKCQE
jgi:frataxin-like iron-binding protein CyaY